MVLNFEEEKGFVFGCVKGGLFLMLGVGFWFIVIVSCVLDGFIVINFREIIIEYVVVNERREVFDFEVSYSKFLCNR